MGYTHYWKINKRSKKESAYQAAIQTIAKVARSWQKDNSGTEESLSGYTAHTKPNQYSGVLINGKGDLAHEPFVLRKTLSENEDFSFCKTAQKPYDTVVVASLLILKAKLGNDITVSSDGCKDEWYDGCKLAEKVLRKKLDKVLDDIFNA